MGIANDIRPKHPSYRAEKTKTERQTETTNKVAPESAEAAGAIKAPPETGAAKLFETSNPERRQLEDQFFSDLPRHRKDEVIVAGHHGRNTKTAWIILLWLLVFTAVIGYALYQNYSGLFRAESEPQAVSSDEQNYNGEIATQDELTESAPAKPTPESPVPAAPTIDKGQVTVRVLNGNGIKGSAQSVSQTIKQAGFKIAGVSNAANFNYVKTIIYHQTGKENEAKLVQETLSGRETELTLSDTVADDNNIVVVVGDK
ncbi:MAG: LytR C-terminal domain-containing protein [Patescibacteria group bacterium]